MKRKIIWLILAILLITAGGLLYTKYFRDNKKTDGFTAISAQRGDISTEVSVTGVLEPRIKVTLTASKAGQVEEIFVNEGDTVKNGQTLATVSSEDRINLLVMAKKNLETAKIAEDAAAITKAENELRLAESAYQKIPVNSPIAGLVTLRNVEPGQKVEAATTILEVSDELVVKVLVDETDIGKIREGMKAKVSVDAYPDKEITGRIIKIAYTSTSQSNVTAYQVLIKLLSGGGDILKSGMTADASIIVQGKKNVIKLPLAAVKTGRGRKTVLIEGSDGRPYPAEVKTGIENEESVEIVSGIEEGDKVITSNSSSAKSEDAKADTKKKGFDGPPPMMMGGGPR